jgi:hypothetical protein
MATKTARVTVTLPTDVLEGIDRFERNRSRFIAQAVGRELVRRRRRGLLKSIKSPHVANNTATGLPDWTAGAATNADGIVDASAGNPVRWIEGLGWVAEPDK